MDLASLGFKLLNPAMNAILRSPIHFVVSRRLMAIEYEGVKSKKQFSVPVSYFNLDGAIYCFTDGKWWNNFKRSKSVVLILKNKRKQANALAIKEDKKLFIDVLSMLIAKFPADARYYGVKLGSDKKPLSGELEKAFDNNIMVKFSGIA